MKNKFIVLILILVLCIGCSATAEVKTFVFSGVCDIEGNPVEGDYIDLSGMTVSIDDEAGTIAVGSAENEEKGTIEIRNVKGGLAIYAEMESGEEAVYAYSTAADGAEVLTLTDSQGTQCVIFTLS